jgi:hypothetical protein
VRDDARRGRPSVVNEDLVRAVEVKIWDNRRFAITPLSLHFPQISPSLLHKIVSEFIEAVTTCFASQAASLCDKGIQKLVQRYDKCLNNSGNYVGKQCTVCTSNGNIQGLQYILVFLLLNSPSELTSWITLIFNCRCVYLI